VMAAHEHTTGSYMRTRQLTQSRADVHQSDGPLSHRDLTRGPTLGSRRLVPRQRIHCEDECAGSTTTSVWRRLRRRRCEHRHRLHRQPPHTQSNQAPRAPTDTDIDVDIGTHGSMPETSKGSGTRVTCLASVGEGESDCPSSPCRSPECCGCAG
jgi:hypothetical protein